jgi:hypothetical protein
VRVERDGSSLEGVGGVVGGWGGRGEVPHLYRGESRVCFGL